MMSGAAAITVLRRDDPVLGVLASGERREHLDAAGDLDQLRHPVDAGDHRVVPFLEIDARMARESTARARAPCAVAPRATRASASALRLHTDERADGADHVEDAGDVALVEGMHRDVAADQLGDDVGLQVGEGQHEVGLEREDLLDSRRR